MKRNTVNYILNWWCFNTPVIENWILEFTLCLLVGQEMISVVYLSDFKALTVLCESLYGRADDNIFSLVHCRYACRSFSLLSTPSNFVKIGMFFWAGHFFFLWKSWGHGLVKVAGPASLVLVLKSSNIWSWLDLVHCFWYCSSYKMGNALPLSAESLFTPLFIVFGDKKHHKHAFHVWVVRLQVCLCLWCQGL